MKPINTIPVEEFLNKTRIAIKSNQKSISLDIKEAQALYDSLALIMTRMVGELDQAMNTEQSDVTQIKMDGGNF
jgi:hypothetical protein